LLGKDLSSNSTTNKIKEREREREEKREREGKGKESVSESPYSLFFKIGLSIRVLKSPYEL
jgi:hypothetical protein